LNQARTHSVRFIVYSAAVFGVALALWIGRMFGSPTIDQIRYHLRYAEGAAVEMSEVFAATFLVEVAGVALALGAVAAALHAWLTRGRSGWQARIMRAVPPVALAAGATVLLLQFSVFSYAAAHFDEDRFGRAYLDPSRTRLTEVGRRNLILIYVESLEETYSDAALFGTDLITPLRSLGGNSLPAYHQSPGATWTIAAMVATQCGVPLTVYSESSVREDRGRSFLAGATCLGDILQARGYRNVFLGGAPLSFAGKGAFLRDHGYQDRYGKEEWLAAGARPPGSGDPELGGWGMFDDALFARGRAKVAALHAAGQPFALTMLTLDTHNPNGYFSPRCSRGRTESSGADFPRLVTCTSESVAEFVRFVRDSGFLEDTTVVILGDHLAVGNPVDAKLRGVGDRRVFNLFLGTPPFPAHVQRVVSFDMFPTLLEAVGLRTEDGRLGLGRSAWAPQEPAQSEWLRQPNLPALSASPTYRRLWERAGENGD
jgi:phosphoglycerol transferase